MPVFGTYGTVQGLLPRDVEAIGFCADCAGKHLVTCGCALVTEVIKVPR